VFACSWSDFFHPAADPWRHEAWNVVRATKKHDYLILTKRPELIEARLPNDWYVGFQHVTLGVTVEDQAAVDRVCLFRRVMGPAVRLFVSVEPIIGPVDFSGLEHDISWIIVAGESGPNRRRPETAWVEGIAAWCARNAVPYFFKRWADEREARGHKEACERREWPTWIRGRAGSAC
jgi:protein gp37